MCDELLGDFPFIGQSERAHAVAMFLLPFARDLIGSGGYADSSFRETIARARAQRCLSSVWPTPQSAAPFQQ